MKESDRASVIGQGTEKRLSQPKCSPPTTMLAAVSDELPKAVYTIAGKVAGK